MSSSARDVVPRPARNGPDPAVDVDVLVVGTGPTGGACTLALATYGIDVMAITKRRWLANSPRAHITNQRALEVLRDLGVEADATRSGTPWEQMREMVFARSLAVQEVARLRTWGAGIDRLSDYLQGSPCPLLDLPQPLLEPILIENAAARGADVRFRTEYISHEQDDAGVTTRLRDRLTGDEYAVRSRFLVGADGARSKIVDDVGLPLKGTMGRAGTVYVRFHADLGRYVAHRPGILHRLLLPATGEIGLTTLRAVRPWNEWIAGWGYDIEGPEPQLTAEQVLPRLRSMIGDADVDVEVLDISTWQINQAWATRYSSGRVFCGGDAVHRHPPSSGLGSNTSIQDAHNLAWKLAFVLKGWAGVPLLESYSQERAPVGEAVVARANQSRADYAALNAVIAELADGDGGLDLDPLTDPSPGGVRLREALVDAIELKNDEFNAQGTELNQRYASSAVVPDPSAGPERWARDRGRHLQATTRPGAKVPHAWLVDEAGSLVSTLDLTGKGAFSLVTGIAGTAWAEAVARLGLPYLRSVVIGASGAQDAYHDWHRLRETHEAGAVLVRPDGYVAWRHPTAVWEADAARDLLTAAVAGVLATDGLPSEPSGTTTKAMI